MQQITDYTLKRVMVSASLFILCNTLIDWLTKTDKSGNWYIAIKTD